MLTQWTKHSSQRQRLQAGCKHTLSTRCTLWVQRHNWAKARNEKMPHANCTQSEIKENSTIKITHYSGTSLWITPKTHTLKTMIPQVNQGPVSGEADTSGLPTGRRRSVERATPPNRCAPIKAQQAFLVDSDEWILRFIWKCKALRRAKITSVN